MTDAERAEVAKFLASCERDPLAFVRGAFMWGVPGTSLEQETGPDEWQISELREIGESLVADPFVGVRRSTASGHGIGKSAEVAWVVCWGLMTLVDSRGTITSNTDTQLRTKTLPELAKWYHLLIPPLRELFTLEATSIHAADKARERTWRIDAIPWSERNPEAFAGLHNAGRRIVLIFDEASAIADTIWDTAEGATTDENTQVIWCAYGNPTRATGRFRETVSGRFRHLWRSRSIDSRKVKRTNKTHLDALVEAYGEDSDFVRVRVKGEFPRASSTQFVATDVVQAARKRVAGYIASDPLVWGLDVARFGDDASVLAGRRGRDARMPWKRWRKLDTMQIAAQAFEHMQPFGRPDAVFVDVSGGLGAGPADRLRQIAPQWPIIDVNFGGSSETVMLTNGMSQRAHNKSAVMWVRMRDWLTLGAIPDDDHLESDLTGREYGFDGDNSIQLERKEDMKKRGLSSPDDGDALALTFADPVMPRAVPGYADMKSALGVKTEYDLHADLRG